MLRRKIENVLLSWKESAERKPLIVKGCRQCGKTSSVLDFAKKNYENVVYLNFVENRELAGAFKDSLRVDDIVMVLSAFMGDSAHFVPNRTVIILDEIQECPQARASLKFFSLDGRYDIIGTGSLLGVSGYGERSASIPVGYETVIDMYPLDFEEFLWANGINESVIEALEECMNETKPVPEALHTRMNELLRHYIVVGGMPEVVQNFVEQKRLDIVLGLQRNIVRSYEDDMVKYADKGDKSSIRECFQSIPKQLAKENKKFQYSLIQGGGSSRKFKGSIQWIEDAGIIVRCYNLSVPELPLGGNADKDTFKIYMTDIGLLVSMLEDGSQADIIKGNLGIYKGAVYENLVADIFSKMGRKLYYFRKDSGLEIDYVIRYKGEATLVEVKATSGNAKSMKTVLSHPEKYHVSSAFKLGGEYNVGHGNGFITLPLYLAFLMKVF